MVWTNAAGIGVYWKHVKMFVGAQHHVGGAGAGESCVSKASPTSEMHPTSSVTSLQQHATRELDAMSTSLASCTTTQKLQNNDIRMSLLVRVAWSIPIAALSL
mmetsp:Transcript_12302/g.28807  ORF Transcript_12302/g.28807 Transcript_12302/m.28807 type:complete len:103 (-) Transcript_12302:659-967(-)